MAFPVSTTVYGDEDDLDYIEDRKCEIIPHKLTLADIRGFDKIVNKEDGYYDGIDSRGIFYITRTGNWVFGYIIYGRSGGFIVFSFCDKDTLFNIEDDTHCKNLSKRILDHVIVPGKNLDKEEKDPIIESLDDGDLEANVDIDNSAAPASFGSDLFDAAGATQETVSVSDTPPPSSPAAPASSDRSASADSSFSPPLSVTDSVWGDVTTHMGPLPREMAYRLRREAEALTGAGPLTEREDTPGMSVSPSTMFDFKHNEKNYPVHIRVFPKGVSLTTSRTGSTNKDGTIAVDKPRGFMGILPKILADGIHFVVAMTYARGKGKQCVVATGDRLAMTRPLDGYNVHCCTPTSRVVPIPGINILKSGTLHMYMKPTQSLCNILVLTGTKDDLHLTRSVNPIRYMDEKTKPVPAAVAAATEPSPKRARPTIDRTSTRRRRRPTGRKTRRR